VLEGAMQARFKAFRKIRHVHMVHRRSRGGDPRQTPEA
jgi:hypothetical protein